MLFLSYFTLILSNNLVPTSLYTYFPSYAPIVTWNELSFFIHVPPSLNIKTFLHHIFHFLWSSEIETFSSANSKHLLINLSWLLDGNLWKKIMFLLFAIFLNRSMPLLVSFHWFTLIKFRRLVFILSTMDLQILLCLFLVGFGKRTSGWFKEFVFWPFVCC